MAPASCPASSLAVCGLPSDGTCVAASGVGAPLSSPFIWLAVSAVLASGGLAASSSEPPSDASVPYCPRVGRGGSPESPAVSTSSGPVPDRPRHPWAVAKAIARGGDELQKRGQTRAFCQEISSGIAWFLPEGERPRRVEVELHAAARRNARTQPPLFAAKDGGPAMLPSAA